VSIIAKGIFGDITCFFKFLLRDFHTTLKISRCKYKRIALIVRREKKMTWDLCILNLYTVSQCSDFYKKHIKCALTKKRIRVECVMMGIIERIYLFTAVCKNNGPPNSFFNCV
jgi:hypothetical protein